MALILEPLKTAAQDGVEMKCADRGVRRVYPLVAAHIGDWPEHCTVGSTINTRCPICIAAFKERGDWGPLPRLRTKAQTVDVIRSGHRATLDKLGLRPVLPYWTNHPWAAGPASIMPDLLHQLWKGVYLDHLRMWWTRLLGVKKVGVDVSRKRKTEAGNQEMDRRYKGVPRYAGQQHFDSGLSALTQWTGNEAKATARVFLPVIAGSTPRKAVRAARSVKDFLYRARMPQLDEDDLAALEDDLREFHATKNIFIDKRVHTSKYGFNNISKLHMLRHYMHITREMGTPDGYTTETPERLHKDFIKVSYQATNGVEPEPQMIINLRHMEAWQMLRSKYEREGLIAKRKRRERPEEEPIEDEGLDGDEWLDVDETEDDQDDDQDELEAKEELAAMAVDNRIDDEEGQQDNRTRTKEVAIFQFGAGLQIGKRPLHAVFEGRIITHVAFMGTVTNFVRRLDPNLAFHLDDRSKFRVWSRFSLHHEPLPFAPLVGRKVDLIRASPMPDNLHDHGTRPAVLDTVLLEAYPEMVGLLRYRAARVRLIFQLPTFCHHVCPDILAFVELFDPFNPAVSANHLLATTRATKRNGVRATAIVPIQLIRASCQLVPNYDRLNPGLRISATSDLLSTAPEFFLSRHSSYYFFSVMDHWRRMMQ